MPKYFDILKSHLKKNMPITREEGIKLCIKANLLHKNPGFFYNQGSIMEYFFKVLFSESLQNLQNKGLVPHGLNFYDLSQAGLKNRPDFIFYDKLTHHKISFQLKCKLNNNLNYLDLLALSRKYKDTNVVVIVFNIDKDMANQICEIKKYLAFIKTNDYAGQGAKMLFLCGKNNMYSEMPANEIVLFYDICADINRNLDKEASAFVDKYFERGDNNKEYNDKDNFVEEEDMLIKDIPITETPNFHEELKLVEMPVQRDIPMQPIKELANFQDYSDSFTTISVKNSEALLKDYDLINKSRTSYYFERNNVAHIIKKNDADENQVLEAMKTINE
jgi:hypothetical protein